LRDRLAAEAAKRRPRDPLGWAAHHGIHWWSAQRAIAESVDRNKRTAVRAGHGVGKTYTAAGLASWWIDTRPDGMVVSTAPSAHQVHAILWEEIRALHRRLSLPGRVLLNDTWTMGDRLVGFGRKPPDAAKGSDFDPSTFQGIHRAGGVLVIIDEGGGVPEWLFTAAETITTTDNSRILVIGNPDNPGSQFAQVCTAGHPGWAQLRISVFDSPNYTGETIPPQVAAALTPRSWAAERADEWGTDSPLYLSKVMAEFPSDHPQQLSPWPRCSPAASRSRGPRRSWCPWSWASMSAAAGTSPSSASGAGCARAAGGRRGRRSLSRPPSWSCGRSWSPARRA
jgi:hypothetical protein